jgi:hypothetical protein
VQYARVTVRAAVEPREGVFQPEAYNEILDMMRHLKAARPDLAFFASPRPINAERWRDKKELPYTCFPMWITKFTLSEKNGKKKWTYDGFEPEKAADYMARYIRFMKSKDFKITYLDLKNEVDRLVTPRQAEVMARRLRQGLGEETPLLLAPSSYDYNGAKTWLAGAIEGRAASDVFFDIVTTHNTAEKGSLEEVADLARKLGKPLWNTELHGWNGPDDEAAVNTAALLRQIRAGVGGISDWLSLGNDKKNIQDVPRPGRRLAGDHAHLLYLQATREHLRRRPLCAGDDSRRAAHHRRVPARQADDGLAVERGADPAQKRDRQPREARHRGDANQNNVVGTGQPARRQRGKTGHRSPLPRVRLRPPAPNPALPRI